MEGENALYEHLRKLSTIKSEDALEHILTTLWSTRKTGLTAPHKSHIQSLLSLPSIDELDPAVACLRSLIRKSLHANFDRADVLKLLPHDLPLDIQGILVNLFQKYHNQWKEQVSREKDKRVVLPSSSDVLTSEQPQQDGHNARISCSDFGPSMSLLSDGNTCLAPVQRDVGVLDNLETLPRLKSMSWTMENRKLASADRVAVISLKLQDYQKSPSGEMEIKFQLTKDTLEAMLRPMTCISQQLSSTVGPSSGPFQKK